MTKDATGIVNHNHKEYSALSAKEQKRITAALKKEFGDDWAEVEGLYDKLMRAMGADFKLSSNFSDEYKLKAIEHAQNLKNADVSKKAEAVIFKIHNGQLVTNQNHVTYEGEEFDAKAADEMAFIASHDKDMVQDGISLEGDIYQKALLQLSIKEYCENITIHNALSEDELENNAEAQRAVDDFWAHRNAGASQASATQEFDEAADPEHEGPKAKQVQPSLSEKSLDLVKQQVVEAIADSSKRVTRDVVRDIIEPLLSSENYKGSIPKEIKPVTNWLVDQGIIKEVKHGNSPVVQRYLDDNDTVKAIRDGSKPKSETTSKFGAAVKNTVSGLAATAVEKATDAVKDASPWANKSDSSGDGPGADAPAAP